MSERRVSWQIDGSGAQLMCGPLQARACFGPGAWLSVEKWNSRQIGLMKVLASAFDEQSGSGVDDHYIRGSDLVVDYAATQPHRVVPQVYWRASNEPKFQAVRIELVVSVRTELLDSAPTWWVCSSVPDCDVFHVGKLDDSTGEQLVRDDQTFEGQASREHLFVFRQRASGLSYAEMVHPLDFVCAMQTGQGRPRTEIRSKLFPERMEKGVIRRGRICGWFMPVENDLETAVKLARAFVEEPLPLTA